MDYLIDILFDEIDISNCKSNLGESKSDVDTKLSNGSQTLKAKLRETSGVVVLSSFEKSVGAVTRHE